MSDTHGRFIWYELMTPDIAGSKRFYSDLVGWTCDEMPMADGSAYTIVGPGVGVGGMMNLTDEAKARGVPPNWTGYIAVDDVDAASEKVKTLGGSVIHAPQDIPGIGRFSIVADPSGAVFAMMTPAPMDTPRPDVPTGSPGTVAWHELMGAAPDDGFDFYIQMFGWKRDDAMDMGPMGKYQLFSNQDGQIGAMMKRPAEVPASYWGFYIRAPDIDAAAAKVKATGGQVLTGPMEVPGDDWVIQGQDPQGALFAVVGKKA